jgi:hypothetical protein
MTDKPDGKRTVERLLPESAKEVVERVYGLLFSRCLLPYRCKLAPDRGGSDGHAVGHYSRLASIPQTETESADHRGAALNHQHRSHPLPGVRNPGTREVERREVLVFPDFRQPSVRECGGAQVKHRQVLQFPECLQPGKRDVGALAAR